MTDRPSIYAAIAAAGLSPAENTILHHHLLGATRYVEGHEAELPLAERLRLRLHREVRWGYCSEAEAAQGALQKLRALWEPDRR